MRTFQACRWGGPIEAVAFSPDSKWLFTFDADRRLTAWSSGAFERVAERTAGHWGRLAVSADGTRVVVNGRQTTWWTIPDWQLEGQFDLGPLCFSSNQPGQQYIICDRGRVNCVGPPTVPYSVPGQAHAVAFHPEEREFAAFLDCGRRHPSFRSRRLALAVVDVESREVVQNYECSDASLLQPKLLYSPDGRWLAALFMNGWAVWDATLKLLSVWNKHGSKSVRDLAFSADSRRLLTIGVDGVLRMFDVGSWIEAQAYDLAAGNLHALSVNSDGTLAAIGTRRGEIVLWDLDY